MLHSHTIHEKKLSPSKRDKKRQAKYELEQARKDQQARQEWECIRQYGLRGRGENALSRHASSNNNEANLWEDNLQIIQQIVSDNEFYHQGRISFNEGISLRNRPLSKMQLFFLVSALIYANYTTGVHAEPSLTSNTRLRRLEDKKNLKGEVEQHTDNNVLDTPINPWRKQGEKIYSLKSVGKYLNGYMKKIENIKPAEFNAFVNQQNHRFFSVEERIIQRNLLLEPKNYQNHEGKKGKYYLEMGPLTIILLEDNNFMYALDDKGQFPLSSEEEIYSQWYLLAEDIHKILSLKMKDADLVSEDVDRVLWVTEIVREYASYYSFTEEYRLFEHELKAKQLILKIGNRFSEASQTKLSEYIKGGFNKVLPDEAIYSKIDNLLNLLSITFPASLEATFGNIKIIYSPESFDCLIGCQSTVATMSSEEKVFEALLIDKLYQISSVIPRIYNGKSTFFILCHRIQSYLQTREEYKYTQWESKFFEEVSLPLAVILNKDAFVLYTANMVIEDCLSLEGGVCIEGEDNYHNIDFVESVLPVALKEKVNCYIGDYEFVFSKLGKLEEINHRFPQAASWSSLDKEMHSVIRKMNNNLLAKEPKIAFLATCYRIQYYLTLVKYKDLTWQIPQLEDHGIYIERIFNQNKVVPKSQLELLKPSDEYLNKILEDNHYDNCIEKESNIIEDMRSIVFSSDYKDKIKINIGSFLFIFNIDESNLSYQIFINNDDPKKRENFYVPLRQRLYRILNRTSESHLDTREKFLLMLHRIGNYFLLIPEMEKSVWSVEVEKDPTLSKVPEIDAEWSTSKQSSSDEKQELEFNLTMKVIIAGIVISLIAIFSFFRKKVKVPASIQQSNESVAAEKYISETIVSETSIKIDITELKKKAASSIYLPTIVTVTVDIVRKAKAENDLARALTLLWEHSEEYGAAKMTQQKITSLYSEYMKISNPTMLQNFLSNIEAIKENVKSLSIEIKQLAHTLEMRRAQPEYALVKEGQKVPVSQIENLVTKIPLVKKQVVQGIHHFLKLVEGNHTDATEVGFFQKVMDCHDRFAEHVEAARWQQAESILIYLREIREKIDHEITAIETIVKSFEKEIREIHHKAKTEARKLNEISKKAKLQAIANKKPLEPELSEEMIQLEKELDVLMMRVKNVQHLGDTYAKRQEENRRAQLPIVGLQEIAAKYHDRTAKTSAVTIKNDPRMQQAVKHYEKLQMILAKPLCDSVIIRFAVLKNMAQFIEALKSFPPEFGLKEIIDIEQLHRKRHMLFHPQEVLQDASTKMIIEAAGELVKDYGPVLKQLIERGPVIVPCMDLPVVKEKNSLLKILSTEVKVLPQVPECLERLEALIALLPEWTKGKSARDEVYYDGLKMVRVYLGEFISRLKEQTCHANIYPSTQSSWQGASYELLPSDVTKKLERLIWKRIQVAHSEVEEKFESNKQLDYFAREAPEVIACVLHHYRAKGKDMLPEFQRNLSVSKEKEGTFGKCISPSL